MGDVNVPSRMEGRPESARQLIQRTHALRDIIANSNKGISRGTRVAQGLFDHREERFAEYDKIPSGEQHAPPSYQTQPAVQRSQGSQQRNVVQHEGNIQQQQVGPYQIAEQSSLSPDTGADLDHYLAESESEVLNIEITKPRLTVDRADQIYRQKASYSCRSIP
jgi:hypothetical protein